MLFACDAWFALVFDCGALSAFAGKREQLFVGGFARLPLADCLPLPQSWAATRRCNGGQRGLSAEWCGLLGGLFLFPFSPCTHCFSDWFNFLLVAQLLNPVSKTGDEFWKTLTPISCVVFPCYL